MDAVSGNNDARIATLEKKLKACDDFLASTLQLKEALEKEEMRAVAELLKRRVGLIATIDEMDRRIARYARPATSSRSAAAAGATREIMAQLNDRLGRIAIVNQECEALAAGRRQELRNELATVSREAEGLRGYAKRGGKPPKFLNIRT